MSSTFEIETKCFEIFSRLGWDVSYPNPAVADPGYDMILSYNGVTYGSVMVISPNHNSLTKAKLVKALLDDVVTNIKPRVFIITNGFNFDVYHYGEFYGCLTVPPTPEDVDILFGGEGND